MFFIINYFFIFQQSFGIYWKILKKKSLLPRAEIISKIDPSFTVSLIPFEISTKCKTKLNESIKKLIMLPFITL